MSFPNCSEKLILNEGYNTVSDLNHYCNCSSIPCQNKEIKAKGNIDYYEFNANFSFQSYSIVKFVLNDFRNGQGIEVYFSEDTSSYNKKAIINKIISANETDICYIKGMAKSFKEPKGLFSHSILTDITLNSENDIFFEK